MFCWTHWLMTGDTALRDPNPTDTAEKRGWGGGPQKGLERGYPSKIELNNSVSAILL